MLGIGNPELVAAVMTDWRTAPISAKLHAMLGFLETLTMSPAEVGPADIAPLRAAGLSDRAIEEAIYVCFVFNIMDRLADAFDFKIPTTQDAQRDGQILYRLGYGIASIPG